jgi:diadenosine tetraphosphate (Ap4A) HIT family hydrolase
LLIRWRMSKFRLDPTLAADTLTIAHWPLCNVLLMNEALYPWLILVPRRQGVRELYELSREDRHLWLEESLALGHWLMEEFNGDKLNVAALGNVVAQLHIHHVVRFRTDPAWPGPVWGQHPRKPYSPDALAEMKQRLLPLQNLF